MRSSSSQSPPPPAEKWRHSNVVVNFWLLSIHVPLLLLVRKSTLMAIVGEVCGQVDEGATESQSSQNLCHTSVCVTQAFFLTLAAKKTKTQAQNSSQKLKKKTQSQGGSFLPSRKTQGKNSNLRIFLKKLKGLDLLRYFYYKIFSKSIHFEWKLKFCTEF